MRALARPCSPSARGLLLTLALLCSLAFAVAATAAEGGKSSVTILTGKVVTRCTQSAPGLTMCTIKPNSRPMPKPMPIFQWNGMPAEVVAALVMRILPLQISGEA